MAANMEAIWGIRKMPNDIHIINGSTINGEISTRKCLYIKIGMHLSETPLQTKPAITEDTSALLGGQQKMCHRHDSPYSQENTYHARR